MTIEVDGTPASGPQITGLKTDLGLQNVDNTSDTSKPVSAAQAAAIGAKADASALASHTGSTSNPHSVTKTQVGLGNVDNTSDATKHTNLVVTGSGAGLTLAGDPNANLQAATKQYVDNLLNGLKWKPSVKCATTANGTLATAYENGDTVDGVTLATGDRILIKDQTTGSENGIYVVNASGAPTRAADADSGIELISATVHVDQGTANADKKWTCSNDAITLGSTAIVFVLQGSGVATWGGITGTLASQTDLNTALGLLAALVSPTFTGDPKAPTPATTDNDTSIATTAMVQAAILARALTGLTSGTAGAPLATDTVLQAFGKIVAVLGLLDGGSTGQVLKKSSGTDFAFAWAADAGGGASTTRAVTGTTDTLVVGDDQNFVYYSNASAIAVGIDTSFNGKSTQLLWQTSAGTITLTPSGGATVNGSTSPQVFSGIGGGVLLVAIGTNAWIAIGSIADLQAADITNASANAVSLITAANYAAMRTLLTLVPGTDVLPVNNAVHTGTTTLGQDAASAMQAVTLQQLQAAVMGVGKRTRVRVATTANITIATALVTGQVLNGVTLAAGDLVLVKDQSSGAQNGVYVVGASPARAPEYDTWAELPGSIIGVYEGTTGGDTLWFCTNNDGGTLGTTAIVFTSISVAGALQAANNLSDVANLGTTQTNLGLSAFIKTLIDDADAATARGTLGAAAATLAQGTTVSASRNLAAGDINKITRVDTSSAAVVLTLNATTITAGDRMFFQRNGTNALTIVTGTATVSNPDSVPAVPDGGVIGLIGDLRTAGNGVLV